MVLCVGCGVVCWLWCFVLVGECCVLVWVLCVGNGIVWLLGGKCEVVLWLWKVALRL